MTSKDLVDRIYRTALAYPEKVFSTPVKAYTCINPYSYHIFKANPEIYDRLDGIFVDGMTMCWWIRLLWGKRIPRLSFDMAGMAVDLFSHLNKKDTEEDIYFIGARQDELEATIEQFRKSYPLMKINGYRNGYFKDASEREEAIREIIRRDPKFVIVGMGSPLLERFITDLRNAGFKGISFTCGGFLHQTSRRINYYPHWVNKCNLRAFYRLFNEKGMFKRLWQVLAVFPTTFTLDSIKDRRG